MSTRENTTRNASIRSQPDEFTELSYLSGHWSRELYQKCEQRSALSSVILSFDQKIVHTQTMQSFQIEARRRRYAQSAARFNELLPGSCDLVSSAGDVREELKQMKMCALSALRRTEDLLRVPGVTSDLVRPREEDRSRYGYVGQFKKVFSENLRGVVVYGSAVFGTAPGDYDNFLVVDDIARAYRDAESLTLEHRGLPVHVNFVPSELSKFIFEISSIPSVCSSWWRVIDGELTMPTLAPELVYLQGRARALDMVERRRALLDSRSDTIAASLSTLPLTTAIPIFKAIAHLPAVMVEWTRSFGENPSSRPRTKSTIIDDLSAEGFSIPLYPIENRSAPAIKAELEKGLTLASAVLERSQYLTSIAPR